ncbi:MAG: TolC family protein [Nitrospirae bacterium]|nr:TolC family protein [Nitrospirota bacterium]
MAARIGRTIAFTLFLVITIFSHAFPEQRVLSLKEAVEASFEGNPALRAMARSVSAQQEDIGIATSFLLPRIGVEERVMRTNNPTYAFMAKLNQARFEQQDFAISSLNEPKAITDFQTSVSFEQALLAPKAYIGIDMAEKEYKAKGSDFERKKEEVAFQVLKTYLGVQTAGAYVDVSEKGVGDAKEHLRIADARYGTGLGLYSDVLRAKVALSSAEEGLVSAQKNLDVARRALGLMLGQTESVNVSDERPSLEQKEIGAYYQSAESRKDLKALQTRHKNTENQLRMANAGYVPVIGFGGSYQMNHHSRPLGQEGDSWQMMAFLKWEVFDGLKREHERQKAKHTVSEVGEYVEGLKKQIAFSIYDAYLGVEESKKGLELAKASLMSAEEGRRLVKVRYENNLSAMVDLLDVQTSLDTARAGVIEREGAYLTAIANLGFQSGTLLRDLGVEK